MSRLRLICGTGGIGAKQLVDDKPCFEIFDTFLSEGYSELDTAFIYADGNSEKKIGRYPERCKCIIATKANPWGEQGLSLKYDGIIEQMKISLERLQVNCVDIFYLHAPDHNTPIEETLSACQKLYENGKFKELGLSNYASWQVAEVYYICKQNGWVLPTVYQGMYNPITRMIEGELLPCLRKFGLRFYAYNPLGCGILTGKLKYEDKDDPTKEGKFFGANKWVPVYQKRYWRQSVFDGVAGVRKALDEAYGANKVSMVSATLRWMNHHSAMKPEYNDGIILGGSSLEHFVANIDACKEGPLDKRIVQAYEEVWQNDKGLCVTYYR